ncbi:MAG: hypothetical protein R2769_04820 [Saprospiraceae bacterium]
MVTAVKEMNIEVLMSLGAGDIDTLRKQLADTIGKILQLNTMNKDLKTSHKEILWIALLFGTAFIGFSAVAFTGVDTLTTDGNRNRSVNWRQVLLLQRVMLKIVSNPIWLNPVGEKMLDVDAEALEDVFGKTKPSSKADAYFDANDKIHIKIRQRKPLYFKLWIPMA